jgi:hypothetical protein
MLFTVYPGGRSSTETVYSSVEAGIGKPTALAVNHISIGGEVFAAPALWSLNNG